MRVRPDFREQHRLRDGTLVTLRLIQPTDKDELARAMRAMSPESRYRRFFTTAAEPTPELLRYLTEVDGHDHLAIVAGIESLDLKTERGVSVARFVRFPDEPEVAEAAVAVVDDMQGKGLGTLLLSVLARAARERGIQRFRGEVLATNEPMRCLLEQIGATMRPADAGTMVFEVDLGEPSSESHAESPLRHLLRAAAGKMAEMIRRLGPPA
jgi:GNAT superfamily N-acetyltransferase